MTPNVAVLQIEAPHFHTPRLWIPLFLFWIPLILVVLLISPILFIVVCAISMTTGVRPFRVVRIFWGILCALPGLNVRVSTHDSKVLVRML